jgi:hypothetical protein
VEDLYIGGLADHPFPDKPGAGGVSGQHGVLFSGLLGADLQPRCSQKKITPSTSFSERLLSLDPPTDKSRCLLMPFGVIACGQGMALSPLTFWRLVLGPARVMGPAAVTAVRVR